MVTYFVNSVIPIQAHACPTRILLESITYWHTFTLGAQLLTLFASLGNTSAFCCFEAWRTYWLANTIEKQGVALAWPTVYYWQYQVTNWNKINLVSINGTNHKWECLINGWVYWDRLCSRCLKWVNTDYVCSKLVDSMPRNCDLCCWYHIILIYYSIRIQNTRSINIEHYDADCQGSHYTATEGTWECEEYLLICYWCTFLLNTDLLFILWIHIYSLKESFCLKTRCWQVVLDIIDHIESVICWINCWGLYCCRS